MASRIETREEKKKKNWETEMLVTLGDLFASHLCLSVPAYRTLPVRSANFTSPKKPKRGGGRKTCQEDEEEFMTPLPTPTPAWPKRVVDVVRGRRRKKRRRRRRVAPKAAASLVFGRGWVGLSVVWWVLWLEQEKEPSLALLSGPSASIEM